MDPWVDRLVFRDRYRNLKRIFRRATAGLSNQGPTHPKAPSRRVCLVYGRLNVIVFLIAVPIFLVFVDDRPHMFAFQGRLDMFGMADGVDDLEFLETFGPLQQAEDGPLDDEVIQVQFQKFAG